MSRFYIIGIWIIFVLLDLLCLSIIRDHLEADHELIISYTYIMVPVSLIGCLLLLMMIDNIERKLPKIFLQILLFILLQVSNLYFFPGKK